MLLCVFSFAAGIPCIAAVGVQCPSDFNHEAKTVFDTASVCYGFLGVFKTGKVFFQSCSYLSTYIITQIFALKQFSVCVIAESECSS